MSRMVRDFIEIGGQMSLQQLAGRLTALISELPEGAQDAVVRPHGDAIFGQSLQLTYLRPQTAAERQLEARYMPPAERAA